MSSRFQNHNWYHKGGTRTAVSGFNFQKFGHIVFKLKNVRCSSQLIITSYHDTEWFQVYQCTLITLTIFNMVMCRCLFFKRCGVSEMLEICTYHEGMCACVQFVGGCFIAGLNFFHPAICVAEIGSRGSSILTFSLVSPWEFARDRLCVARPILRGV